MASIAAGVHSSRRRTRRGRTTRRCRRWGCASVRRRRSVRRLHQADARLVAHRVEEVRRHPRRTAARNLGSSAATATTVDAARWMICVDLAKVQAATSKPSTPEPDLDREPVTACTRRLHRPRAERLPPRDADQAHWTSAARLRYERREAVDEQRVASSYVAAAPAGGRRFLNHYELLCAHRERRRTCTCWRTTACSRRRRALDRHRARRRRQALRAGDLIPGGRARRSAERPALSHGHRATSRAGDENAARVARAGRALVVHDVDAW